MMTRLYRFIVGLDQAFNPLVFGGSEDVTLSAQAGYNEVMFNRSKILRRLIDGLFRLFGQKNHCFENLLWEIEEFPVERAEIEARLKIRGLM